MRRLPCLPAGNLLTSCERHRESVIKILLYPPDCVFFCGGAQLSWGFLALGSVLSVALLGGWSLFGTLVGLLGFFLDLSPWKNSSFGLMGLLGPLCNWGIVLGNTEPCESSFVFVGGSCLESLPCSVGHLRSISPTY